MPYDALVFPTCLQVAIMYSSKKSNKMCSATVSELVPQYSVTQRLCNLLPGRQWSQCYINYQSIHVNFSTLNDLMNIFLEGL